MPWSGRARTGSTAGQARQVGAGVSGVTVETQMIPRRPYPSRRTRCGERRTRPLGDWPMHAVPSRSHGQSRGRRGQGRSHPARGTLEERIGLTGGTSAREREPTDTRGRTREWALAMGWIERIASDRTHQGHEAEEERRTPGRNRDHVPGEQCQQSPDGPEQEDVEGGSSRRSAGSSERSRSVSRLGRCFCTRTAHSSVGPVSSPNQSETARTRRVRMFREQASGCLMLLRPRREESTETRTARG